MKGYTYNELNQLPSGCRPSEVNTRHYSEATSVTFQGVFFPFSNFYETEIEIDGNVYSSREQDDQSTKCMRPHSTGYYKEVSESLHN